MNEFLHMTTAQRRCHVLLILFRQYDTFTMLTDLKVMAVSVFHFSLLIQRMSRLDGMITDWVELSMPRLIDGNIFQKRRVSSPAPVTMFWPHGLIDRYKTRHECPVNV